MYREIYVNLTNKVWLTKNIMSAHTHVYTNSYYTEYQLLTRN